MTRLHLFPSTRRITWTLAAFVAGSLVLASGCSDNPQDEPPASQEEALASLSIALQTDVHSPSCPVSFSYPDVKSIRLRLFDEFPDNPNAGSAVFDTSDPSIAPDGCLSFVQCGGANVLIDAMGTGMTQEERTEMCLDEGGTLVPASVIHITEIESQSGMTAYLEAFSDNECEDRVFVGARGKIDISKEEPRNYFVAPLCVGHFSALPHPGLDDIEFTRDIALEECDKDCDCIEAFKNELGLACSAEQFEMDTVPGAPIQCDDGRCSRGYGFEDLLVTPCSDDSTCVDEYPYSRCEDNGYCSVTSYYPLNMLSGRAFHSATELPDGRIVLSGGLTHVDGSTFTAGPVVPVSFHPQEMVFSEMELSDQTEELQESMGRAFHRTQLAANKKILGFAGGLQVVDIQVAPEPGDDARKLKLILGATGPGGGTDSNLRDSLFLLDVGTIDDTQFDSNIYELTAAGNVDGASTDLPQPIALQTSDMVYNNDDGQHIFIGGIAPVDTPATHNQAGLLGLQFANANLATTCVYISTTNVLCKGSANVFTNPRAAATSACFERNDDQVCELYAVVGGANATNAPVAEIFVQKELTITNESGETETVTVQEFDPLESDGADALRRSKFTQTVTLGNGLVLTVGGTDEPYFFGPPSVATYLLSIEEAGEDEVAAPVLDEEPVPEPDKKVLIAEHVNTDVLPGGASDTYRMHHTATMLDDGRILIAGGLNDSNYSTNSVLVFDSSTLEFLPMTLKMTVSRFGHQATPITRGPLKGAILITGGLTLVGEATTPEIVSFAEIFVP